MELKQLEKIYNIKEGRIELSVLIYSNGMAKLIVDDNVDQKARGKLLALEEFKHVKNSSFFKDIGKIFLEISKLAENSYEKSSNIS